MRVVSGEEDGGCVWNFETGECVFFLDDGDTPTASADLHRLVHSNGKDIKLLDFSA
jgi:hypothetical protein